MVLGMKKLNICIITCEFPPECAGIGYAAYHLAQSLKANGHNVTVITRGNWKGNKTRIVENVKVHALWFFPFLPPFHIRVHGFFVNKLLSKLEKELDVVHIQSPLVPIIKTTKPTVVTVHSTWHYEAKFFSKIGDWYSLAVKLFKNSFIEYEMRLFSNADHFISISDTIKRELSHFYKIASSKISVIENGIDINKFSPKKGALINFKVISVGRFVYRKGFQDLISASQEVCSKYPHAEIIIIGDGPLKEKLREQIYTQGLENNVRLLDSTSNDEIINQLRKSSMFVIPSYYEGLPLVLLEALACGLPVVGTNINGIKDLIDNGINGFLIPTESPKRMANAIINLFENTRLRNEMSKNARTSAKRYDRSVLINKTIAVYENLHKEKLKNKIPSVSTLEPLNGLVNVRNSPMRGKNAAI